MAKKQENKSFSKGSKGKNLGIEKSIPRQRDKRNKGKNKKKEQQTKTEGQKSHLKGMRALRKEEAIKNKDSEWDKTRQIFFQSNRD